MSYSVTAAYHTAIKDGVSPQDFMLVDAESPFNNLSAIDGDFVAGTPTVRRSVCESTDFMLGECPSATLNASIMNNYSDGIEFWTKRGASGLSTTVPGRAGIGVQLGKVIYESQQDLRVDLFSASGDIYVLPSGVLVITANAGASLSGTDLNLSNVSEVSITDTNMTIDSGTATAIFINNGTLTVAQGSFTFTASGYGDVVSVSAVYQTATSAYVYLGYADSTIKRMLVTTGMAEMPTISTLSGDDLPGGAMVRKMSELNRSIVYDAYGFPTIIRTYTNGICTEEYWEYCPVGVYVIKIPKYSYLATSIDIVDAMDFMSLLDTNLKELATASEFSLDQSADAIVNAICTAKNIPQTTSYSLGQYTIPVTEDMVGADTSCRQFFKWVGERAGHLWRMTADGFLETYVPADFTENDYLLTDDYLAAGYQIYNQYVTPPEKLIVDYGENLTWTSQALSPTKDDYYKISANPLFVSPTVESPVLPWLTYDELPFKSYQLADCVTVSADPSYGYGDALLISTDAVYSVYIMQETITFGIRAMAEYVATGSEERLDYGSYTVADAIAAAALARAESSDTTAEAALAAAQDASSAAGSAQSAVDELGNTVAQYSETVGEIQDELSEMGNQVGDTATLLETLQGNFNAFKNGPIFNALYQDEDGVHISFTDETNNATGEILIDGANIRFSVDGVEQAVINAAGFHFDYGILTTALQIGDNDIDEIAGEWTWTKAQSGHFRLVYRGN